MMLQVQGYDFQVIYWPGSEITHSDTLSRPPNNKNNKVLELDNRVDTIQIDEIDQININLMNFSMAKQNQIRDETARDPALNGLGQVTHIGWPQTIQELRTALREYWAYRDEVAMENSILLKDKQVLIPAPLVPDILTQLHSGHQGIEKTPSRT